MQRAGSKYAPLITLLVVLWVVPNAHSQVVISEFMADNGGTLLDEDGERSDWIELHNNSGLSVDLAGWRISDQLSALEPWIFPPVTLPADGRLVVFASGQDRVGLELHTDFKLSADGEYLSLSPPGGAPPTSEFTPSYPAQLEDVSYGLSASGPLGFLAEPTPGAPNVDALYQARDVDFDAPRGFYEAAVTVSLSCEEEAAAIRYTTDGSEPSAVNGSDYTSALVFNETTCLRAVALREGMAPSEVSTRSFLFVEDVLSQSHAEAIADGFPAEWIEQDGTPWTDYQGGTHPGAWYGYEAAQLSLHTEEELKAALLSVPSVSLVMSVDDWFGYKPDEGVFGVYTNPQREGEAWDRGGSFEWIDPLRDDGFQINCALGMQGGSGSTIQWASQVSIDAKFQRRFGPGKLRYPLFEDSPIETFDKLVFDAGNQNSIHANAGYTTRRHAQALRDQFMMDLQAEVGQPAVSGRHAHLFINGLYWGLYNVHESPDDNWAANHGGGEPEEYDWVKEGAVFAGNNYPFDHPRTPGSWKTAIEIASNGLAVDDQWGGVSSYEALGEQIDLANYADYMLLNFYGGNLDWPYQNWNATKHARNSAAFSDVNPTARFEFQCWDSETTLNWNGVTAVNDGFYDRTFLGDTEDIANISFIYGRLKSNPEFRLLLADRAQRLISPGGALFVEPGAGAAGTPYEPGQNRPADLYFERSLQIEDAVKLEYARWANYFVGIGSVSPADWEVERTRLLEEFFPVRSDILIQQLSAATPRMYPTTAAPAMSQYGGYVKPGFELELSVPAGEVYVTTDGSDPRMIGGSISTAAQLYSSPISIDGGLTRVKARALSGGEWSALSEAVFTQVLISEVMPRNESVISDEVGEFDDWIEVVNMSSSSVDLSGWLLSDDLLEPSQWALPEGTVLGAGETLIIWADDEEEQGPLHASFKLSAEGERLCLSAPLDDVIHVVDSWSYGAQLADRSIGRMPTGADTFVSLLDPSPGAVNEPAPGYAVRFQGALDLDLHPALVAPRQPFIGQAPSILLSGMTPHGAGTIQVGRAVREGQALVSERLSAFEVSFQADAQGGLSHALLLPRWSNRLQPALFSPASSLFYIQALDRSGTTNGLAVCIQN